MAITGYLSEFSLAELFQFLEQGKKTGLLSLRSQTDPNSGQQQNHYIWFRQGRIVAAANRLDNQGLISLIDKRGWLTNRAASKMGEMCALNTPIGLCLKSQGLLEAEQLKILFYVQVMRQVCALFSLEDAFFHFDTKAPLQTEEMTGLSTSGNEVVLAGLRALKDWGALGDKVPDVNSGLISTIHHKPNLPLNQSEWQVWEYTNGTVSVKDIAAQLGLPVEKVQKIGFRLIVVGIAEEVPIVVAAVNPIAELKELAVAESNSNFNSNSGQKDTLSQSFLQNLVGFLRDRV